MTELTVRAMLEPEAVRLVEEYDIPYPDYGVARNVREAVGLAGHIGYPVVLKVVSPDVLHKSDVGGVEVGLTNSRELEVAVQQMRNRIQEAVPGAAIAGFLVCRQAGPGQEVIVGGIDDATFGPAVMVGLGGILAELLSDVAFRVVPLDHCDAEEMIQQLRGFDLLRGVRGSTPCDLNALADLVLAVSRLLAERRDIAELDLNPVRVFEHGLQVLDVRLLLKKSAH